MKLKDILNHKGTRVWAVKENQTVQEALQILVMQNIGALLVFGENGTIAGIISERDIVRGLHRARKGLEETPVRELMTRHVITASPEDEISAIMKVMTENRIRHLPVMSEGKLAGLVSIGDVVKFLLEESEFQIRHLKEFIYGPDLGL